MKNKIICLLSLISLLLPSLTQAQQGNKPVKGAGPETILARLDTNQNGSLSKDEVRGRMAERFDTIDANGDGEISRKEMREFRKANQNRKGPRQ